MNQQENYYWLLNGYNSVEAVRGRIGTSPFYYIASILFIIGFRALTLVSYREYFLDSKIEFLFGVLGIGICALLVLLDFLYLFLRKTKYVYKAFSIMLLLSAFILEETVIELVTSVSLNLIEVSPWNNIVPFILVISILGIGISVYIVLFFRCIIDFKKGFFHKKKRVDLKRKKKELPIWLILILAAPILAIRQRGIRNGLLSKGFLGIIFVSYGATIFLILMARATACSWLYLRWAFSKQGKEVAEKEYMEG